MIYATVEELQEFLQEKPAPDESARLLARASELIDYSTMDRINANDSYHLKVAKKAVCAQVEYWSEIGESVDVMGPVGSFSIGSFSMHGKSGKSSMPKLAPRAKAYLLSAGLLYCGVKSV